MRRVSILACVVAAMSGLPANAHAQAASPDDIAIGSDPLEVTIVAVDRLPRSGRAVVVVRRGVAPENVVLVEQGRATPEDLGGAIAALRKMRALDAKGSQRREGVIHSFRPSAAWNASQRSGFEFFLTNLARAPEQKIRGVGEGRAITVTVAR